MARDRKNNPQQSTAMESGKRQPMVRRNWPGTPFSLMNRFTDEMERFFENFGFPSIGSRLEHFSPEIDMFERDGKLVVRADVPGMKKEDIKVDVTDNAIILEGERRRDHEEPEAGVYERSYGHFFRQIPLPDSVDTSSAAANFRDGVLEITMNAPNQSQQRRRVEVQGEPGDTSSKSAA